MLNDQGDRVNGHWSRCASIAREWKKRGGEFVVLSDIDRYSSGILLVDTWEVLPTKQSDMTVVVSDTRALSQGSPQLIVNHNIIPRPYENEIVQLLGPKYFMGGNHLGEEYRGSYILDTHKLDKYVLIVPGGAVEQFNKRVDHNMVFDICNSKGMPLVFASGMKPGIFKSVMRNASLVVSPASTTMLEAMSMDKNVLVVRTHSDQQDNYRFARKHKSNFTYGGLRDAIANGSFSRSWPIKVNASGTELVVNKILEIYKQ
jgi:hypothetical protein